MDQLPPPLQLARMITGNWMTQAIYVAAKLGLADQLKDGAKSYQTLASTTGAQPRALYRLLRALASVGIFAEEAGQRFTLTPLAECLRSNVPHSQRALALMTGEGVYHAWGELLYSIRTGQSAFEYLYGMPLFDYLSCHAELGQVFDEAMTGIHGRETAAMLDVYDFSTFHRLVDVGGGNGSLLTEVLRKHPQLRGVLFDLPEVIKRARGALQGSGLEDRCEAVPGNFHVSVPSGGDAYLLRHILHDWDDERAVRILRNCERAMPTGGRLLVVESVLPLGNEPSFGKLLDLTMLVIPGGLERTEEEFRALLETAGFRLTKIVPTTADVCVIEGVKH
jgi:hypothetical protein